MHHSESSPILKVVIRAFVYLPKHCIILLAHISPLAVHVKVGTAGAESKYVILGMCSRYTFLPKVLVRALFTSPVFYWPFDYSCMLNMTGLHKKPKG